VSEARVLAGRYELLDVLGVGGMSVVHRARDLTTGELVALKLVASHLADDPVIGYRFSAEAEHLRAVSHPNLVRVLDVGEDGSEQFLVMELVDGETLEQRLRRVGVLPLIEAAEIVAAVASGLTALHDAGLVHRDVKPANILVGTDGLTRLGDFGLVRGVPMGLTLPGTTVGTLSYLAPELLHGADATPGSDAWALGAVAYRSLTGALPYPATTVIELVEEHARPPLPPSIAEPALPVAVDAPLLAVLGPPPARPTARELAAALKAIAAGGVVAGMPEDWSVATTAVLRTTDAVGGPAPMIAMAAAAAPTAARRRVPIRAAALAGGALLVAAVVLAAGVPQQSVQPLPGAIGTMSRTEPSPSSARTPSTAVTRTPPPVAEAAQRQVGPPPNRGNNHGPRQGPGPPPHQGPPPGHGPGHGHGPGQGGDGQDENGD
jgi:serine/threonine-protein kinase